MRINIRDATPNKCELVLVEYSDTLGKAILTKGWT